MQNFANSSRYIDQNNYYGDNDTGAKNNKDNKSTDDREVCLLKLSMFIWL